MSRRLEGRIAIITGSSSGIGRATAFAMASEGAKVVCADLQEGSWRAQMDRPGSSNGPSPSQPSWNEQAKDELQGSTHERIQEKGGEAIFVKTNVSDPASVEALVKAAVEKWGRLDIMVNNAGFALEASRPAPVWETPLDLYQKTMDVNVNGVFYGVKYASAQMIKQDPLPTGDRGWILNACSIYGLVGVATAPTYCTSKGAVANLTRAAALDCAPHRVHVNAVNPGHVATHMTDRIFGDDQSRAFVESLYPFRGLGNPEDIAKAYCFLASDDAQWMTGVNMPVDGGYTASIFPSTYKNDVGEQTTVTRVEAEVDRKRVGREDRYSSFESVKVEKDDRPRRREDFRIYEEHDRPPVRKTEVNIDIERQNHYDTELDVTEREYRRRVQGPIYEVEYERRAPESSQQTFGNEREPAPAREKARISIEEKTMGYYDDAGNYHSFRRGLERAADRILHPLHGGRHEREEISVKESSSAPRESVRYVSRPGGTPAGTVSIPSHHIRIGDLVMLQGRPCQVIRITTSPQTGQHRYLGVDLFTKQLQEESSFMSNPSPSVYVQTMLGPVFKQYRVLDIHDEGVVAMTESGDVIQSLPIIDQGSLFSRIGDAFADGRGSVRVMVINDGGRELAVDYKVIHGSRL